MKRVFLDTNILVDYVLGREHCKVTESFRDKSRGFGIKRVMREKRWPKIKLIAEFCRDSS